jgi:hypothetical protein
VQGLTFAQERLTPVDAGARYTAQLGGGDAVVELRTENGIVTLQAASADPADDTTAPPDTLAPPTRPVPADSPATDGAQQQPASPGTLGPEPADPEPVDTAGTAPARPDPTPADTTGAPADTTDG